jgi:putative transposase
MKYASQEYYHIYNRGNNKQRIFLEPENYRFFTQRLHQHIKKAQSALIAYCLMPNHYHAVVYTGDCGDFSNALRGFTTSYVKAFNAWHYRVGHLFQDNTQMRLIGSDEDLINLCRYVHLNPVVAGLVKSPDDWEYSDYHEWLSESLPPQSPIWRVRGTWFSSGSDYRRFVDDRAAELKERSKLEKILFEPPGRSPSST